MENFLVEILTREVGKITNNELAIPKVKMLNLPTRMNMYKFVKAASLFLAGL